MISAARAANGITQAELARKISCSQSRISKIENGLDEQLRIKDLMDYSVGLDQSFRLAFHLKKPTLVEEVKMHAFAMKGKLSELVELAKKDGEINAAVEDLMSETHYNLLKIFADVVAKLPGGKDEIDTEIYTEKIPSAPEHVKVGALHARISKRC